MSSLIVLEVYEAVCEGMDSLGAEFKSSSVGKAAMGVRGGAPALLLAIKDALEARAKGPPRAPAPLHLSRTALPQRR